ncbi:MAG TPA: hypothetical protein VNL73_07085 [Verrucomicrobiae bacterium]|nr:hypothetical protein [Verrucomicrobiae bacterium]
MRINVIWPLIVMGAVFLLSGGAFAQSNIYTFPGPDVDLGQSSRVRVVSGGHYIGGRGDTVYVLRQLGHTYCHKSTDGGKTFNSGVQVNSTAGAVNASLKVDTAGIVYVAYQDEFADIRFTKSTDGGQTFTPAIKVNDDTIPQTGQEKPAIAVNNKGQIFIAWRDQRTDPGQPHKAVFATASYNGGLTFTSNIQVNDSTQPMGGGIDIGVDSSCRVYVAWDPYSGPLFMSRSDDSANTFYLRTAVSDGVLYPSIAVSTMSIGVIWEDVRIVNDIFQQTLRFSVSSDLGQMFSSSIVVDSSGQPQNPSLAWANNIFYTAWRATHRRTPGGPYFDHIWFSYSRDSGQTFVPFVDAIPDDTNFVVHESPSIWVNETEKVFVAWIDSRWDPFDQSLWHLFVSVGTPHPAKGDLNFDGIINMVDIVLELNTVFLGEPFPAPPHRADGNCDGQVTPADMVILLNRWYRDIPFPCD